ncbi:MAG: DUF4154 domain-containing protein [Verrucomicrobia bacterium]|nr:DUF4154 domain-containing protein [Verrucomicrobiota bacterium]
MGILSHPHAFLSRARSFARGALSPLPASGGLWLAAALTVAGQAPLPSEYQVKAAFLYNFAKFVEWPTNAFAAPDTPILIGVFGENPFGHDLEATVAGKIINGRQLEVRAVKTLAEARRCHILFITAEERRRRGDLLNSLQSASVLTVSEGAHPGAGDGVMIDLFMERKRVLFYIDNEAAQRAGLKISPRLLKLSRRSSND